jgi:hypothetical protein
LDLLVFRENPDPWQPVRFPGFEPLDGSQIRLWSSTQIRFVAVMTKAFWTSARHSRPDLPISGLRFAETLHESLHSCGIRRTDELHTPLLSGWHPGDGVCPVPAASYWGHPRDKRERLGAARQRGFGRRKDPVEEITTVAGDQILRTLRRADGFVLD